MKTFKLMVGFLVNYSNWIVSMRVLKLLVVFLVIFCAKADKRKRNKSSASNAISSILQEYFSTRVWKVDVISYGIKAGKSEDLAQSVLRNVNGSTAIEVMKAGNGTKKLKTSTILLFDSIENFRETIEAIEWQNDNITRHSHLVHIQDATLRDLEVLKGGFSIDRVDFLVNENEKSIDLVTSFMFTPQKCRSNQFVRINRFNKSTRQWEDSNFYPNKYQNFHDCSLKVFSEIGRSEGFNKYFIETLAKVFNFKYTENKINSYQTLYASDEVDLFNAPSITPDPNYFVLGHTYEILQFKFLIPFGELYSPVAKMFFMFQREVWIAIAATLLFYFTVIQVINRCSITVRNFVFGRNIKTPTVNLLDNFLSGAQYKVPGRNFARFMLTLLIIWCLIIRTCYQSELFKHLQADWREPEATSLLELMERNFSFYCSSYFHDELRQIAKENGFSK